VIKVIDVGESKKEIFFGQVLIVPAKSQPVTRKETKNQPVCPYCNNTSFRVWVHGHFQCQRCKNVISSDCEVIWNY